MKRLTLILFTLMQSSMAGSAGGEETASPASSRGLPHPVIEEADYTESLRISKLLGITEKEAHQRGVDFLERQIRKAERDDPDLVHHLSERLKLLELNWEIFETQEKLNKLKEEKTQLEKTVAEYIDQVAVSIDPSGPLGTQPDDRREFWQHIHEREDFLAQLQEVFGRGNKQEIAHLVEYPLAACIEGEWRMMNSPEELLASFDLIFTAEIVATLLNQQPERLFSNWQGTMVGSGQMWFGRVLQENESSGMWLITAVNTGGGCKPREIYIIRGD